MSDALLRQARFAEAVEVALLVLRPLKGNLRSYGLDGLLRHETRELVERGAGLVDPAHPAIGRRKQPVAGWKIGVYLEGLPRTLGRTKSAADPNRSFRQSSLGQACG